MAKSDGQLLSPQAKEELLGDDEDPKRTVSTTGNQDPIYSMIGNVKSLGAGFAKSRPAAHGSRPKAHFTVHIPRSSLEFLSAVFYSACSDLCSKMVEGEFWFLCNFNRFNALQSFKSYSEM